MKRVLLTVHKFFPEHKAGTEVLTLKVAQELQKRNYEVLVVCGNPPDLDARRKPEHLHESSDFVFQGVPVHVVEEALRLKNYTFAHEYYHPDVKAHFAELLEKFRPDILHVFHAQNLSAGIVEAANQKGIPVVASCTDFWFVCPVVQLKRPDGSVCRGPSPGAVNCLTCYTPELLPRKEEFCQAFAAAYPDKAKVISALPGPVSKLCWEGLFRLYLAKKLPQAVSATIKRPKTLQQFANRIMAIMVPTKLMQDIFVENGIEAKLIHKVPFGIDTAPLEAFQNKSASDTLRIGYIGTLFEHKGVDLLVEAFQKLPSGAKASLHIYGDPNQFPEYGRKLMDMANRDLPNSDKIVFAGTFPNDRLGEVLSGIDVLVVPSRWYENTPLVIQSALASKTPLIVTNLGGMSEIIDHGKNGLLFDLNSADSLKEQLARLLSEEGLLEKLRAGIKKERTVADMVDDIENIYRLAAPKMAREVVAK